MKLELVCFLKFIERKKERKKKRKNEKKYFEIKDKEEKRIKKITRQTIVKEFENKIWAMLNDVINFFCRQVSTVSTFARSTTTSTRSRSRATSSRSGRTTASSCTTTSSRQTSKKLKFV